MCRQSDEHADGSLHRDLGEGDVEEVTDEPTTSERTGYVALLAYCMRLPSPAVPPRHVHSALFTTVHGGILTLLDECWRSILTWEMRKHMNYNDIRDPIRSNIDIIVIRIYLRLRKAS